MGAALLCPVCGNCNLHHEAIEWWTRPGGEDGHSEVTILGEVREGRVPDHSHNPSSRRNGLRLRLYCEFGCDVPALDISQHKGVTFIEWGT